MSSQAIPFLQAGENVYKSFSELMAKCEEGCNQAERTALKYYGKIKENELVVYKTAIVALGSLLAYHGWEMVAVGWFAAKIRPQKIEKMGEALKTIWSDTHAGKLFLVSSGFLITAALPWQSAALLYGAWTGYEQVTESSKQEEPSRYTQVTHALRAVFGQPAPAS
jgi:hypothetical protein